MEIAINFILKHCLLGSFLINELGDSETLVFTLTEETISCIGLEYFSLTDDVLARVGEVETKLPVLLMWHHHINF